MAGGKFGKFGESSMIHKTKTIQISIIINNLLADLLIPQTFLRQKYEKSQFTKVFPCKTFLLYGNPLNKTEEHMCEQYTLALS